MHTSMRFDEQNRRHSVIFTFHLLYFILFKYKLTIIPVSTSTDSQPRWWSGDKTTTGRSYTDTRATWNQKHRLSISGLFFSLIFFSRNSWCAIFKYNTLLLWMIFFLRWFVFILGPKRLQIFLMYRMRHKA